ncbi:MAG: translation elongation factor Ts [Alphaproteobacteria bacterium]|nr:translation elongation factor Ts [Alphaproteobacteria bacterium]
MTAITASLVKELREKTGVGMMDCKKALTENGGDMEAAVDWLRKKGLSKAAKKADRVAAEGLVGAKSTGTAGAVVEINSETDFVARNEQFQGMVGDITDLALAANGDLSALLASKIGDKGLAVEDYVKEMVATIGENMTVRRSAALSVQEGVVSAYVHNKAADDMGKIGVLVALESSGDKDKLAEFGRQLSMHVAAANPLALKPDELDSTVIDRERAIYTEQAKASGKPPEIVEKMVEGRLRKEFFQQVVLLQQTFVIDGKATVEQAVKTAEKSVGAPIKLAGFVRYALGDGVEKQEDDFAAEVAAAAGSK